MYTVKNYPTKKALKEAVARGEQVTVFQPNDMFGVTSRTIEHSKVRDVQISLEGPHYPKPHTWYAQATIRDGFVVKVK